MYFKFSSRSYFFSWIKLCIPNYRKTNDCTLTESTLCASWAGDTVPIVEPNRHQKSITTTVQKRPNMPDKHLTSPAPWPQSDLPVFPILAPAHLMLVECNTWTCINAKLVFTIWFVCKFVLLIPALFCYFFCQLVLVFFYLVPQ